MTLKGLLAAFRLPLVPDRPALTVVDVARLFRYVRELPENRGQRVEAMQRWCGGKPGDAWCAHFLTFVLDVHYQGKAPLPRHGSCDVLLAMCASNGWIVEKPQLGDIYFRLKGPTDAVHVGFVTSAIANGRLGQLSGNTSEDGLSREGTGVFERDIPAVPALVFARLPQPT